MAKDQKSLTNPGGVSMEDMAAFRAWQASQGAGGTAPKAPTGSAPKLQDTSEDGGGREVYVRDMPSRAVLHWEDGHTYAVTLDVRLSEKGKPMSYGGGVKVPVKLVSGDPAYLQASLCLTLCKPAKTGKPANGAPPKA